MLMSQCDVCWLVPYERAVHARLRCANRARKRHRLPRSPSTGNGRTTGISVETSLMEEVNQERRDGRSLDGDSPVLCQHLFPCWSVSPLSTETVQNHRRSTEPADWLKQPADWTVTVSKHGIVHAWVSFFGWWFVFSLAFSQLIKSN